MMTIAQNSAFYRFFGEKPPVVLAPLAGITDVPMRELYLAHGFDLCYVEMISATALLYDNKKTVLMTTRGANEGVLGMQLYGRDSSEIARAIELIDNGSFDTFDINMGCPVQKVVKTGAGSAMLKDPAMVYETLRLARSATPRPLSVKIRLGWDRSSLNFLEIIDAAERAGVDWITIHGRTRSENYGEPVDLQLLSTAKKRLKIPLLGNGNLFSRADTELMRESVGVDGFMIARGALGNPWLAQAIKENKTIITLDEWLLAVTTHLNLQEQYYGAQDGGATLRMRKQLIWYATGWPGVKQLREKINTLASITEAKNLVIEFAEQLSQNGISSRPVHCDCGGGIRFKLTS